MKIKNILIICFIIILNINTFAGSWQLDGSYVFSDLETQINGFEKNTPYNNEKYTSPWLLPDRECASNKYFYYYFDENGRVIEDEANKPDYLKYKIGKFGKLENEKGPFTKKLTIPNGYNRYTFKDSVEKVMTQCQGKLKDEFIIRTKQGNKKYKTDNFGFITACVLYHAIDGLGYGMDRFTGEITIEDMTMLEEAEFKKVESILQNLKEGSILIHSDINENANDAMIYMGKNKQGYKFVKIVNNKLNEIEIPDNKIQNTVGSKGGIKINDTIYDMMYVSPEYRTTFASVR